MPQACAATKVKEAAMDWGTFGQIALLIILFVVAKTFMKCMHDTYCKKCKAP